MVLRHGVQGGFAGVWPLPAKPCDSCKAAPALLFCRADSAFLCMACDSKVHGANRLASRHERVWMCEVCEQAPASVTCKADAAALCVACDADIHSANPLARRHDRVPVVPFFEPAASALAKSDTGPLFHKNDDDDDDSDYKSNNSNGNVVVVPVPVDEEEDGTMGGRDEEAWLLPNLTATKVVEQPDQFKSGDFLFTEVDPFLDLDYGSPMAPRFGANNSSAMDSVVPVQTTPPPPPFPCLFPPSSGHAFFDAARDYCQPKPCYSYNTTTPSLSHSVSSSSSLEVGVVPDGSDIGGGGNKAAAGVVVDAATTPAGAGVDREARVLRYREKRKNRKFEKTIRYASRKAYAETRPRIKGRFAKRTDQVEGDADGIYSSAAAAMIADAAGYGVVPSF